jgi:CRISPR-associated endonuclease/helicase Cas3
MGAESEAFFADYFVKLTARPPYPWQRKLFSSFIAPATEPWPEVVDLPTGAGKTSVLHVWLLALAWSIRAETFSVPRRLAWIVNRRVVVDQVTAEVEEILKRLADKCSETAELCVLLASLSGTPLAASTLRGQLADDGDWSRDPSTPAVVVGTVDMIGSRLLFRGYRAGRYHRPMHAGLLGVDTLIVNDEAHLSPALARLLTGVRGQNPAGRISGKSFRILLLSATHDGANGLKPFDHDLREDVAESDTFRDIFRAPKSLALHEVTNLNELDAATWKLATESPVARTAIFIREPEKAAKLAGRLRKDERSCALLTGTMRGFERDGLLEDEIFKRFLSREPVTEPTWLVCTSAGEVGINFSCERMITGLEEADHLLQRFGRLNRFGSPIPGEAHVVFRNPSEKEAKLQRTLEYLRELKGDVSCARIWEIRPPLAARTEQPAFARLESRHVDVWSQTTYPDRFVPAVASWLHGKQESEVPDTEVAWRSDVGVLTEWGIGEDQIREVLEYYPVQSQETLSEPASRVAGKLSEILARVGTTEGLKTKLILVESDGTPSICDLAHLVKQAERNRNFLDYKMLLLPDGLGSVPSGMFHAAAQADQAKTMDVADTKTTKRIRFLFDGDKGAYRLPRASVDETPPPRIEFVQYASVHTYKPALVIEHPNPDKEDHFLVYFAARPEKKWVPKNVKLADHQASVAAKARTLADRVGLHAFEETYEKAGNIHDAGKARDVWQRAMGGKKGDPLAKTEAPVNIRLIDGYRHELGSLVDAIKEPERLTDDLLLHLIASHHAGARPYFETKQYDRENLRCSATESIEIARRYARLQAEYGAWGLAYLEAVFKCADGLVSAAEGDPASA